jgi:hypothetical protein
MLGITERASEMYGLGMAGGWPIARALGNAFASNENRADPDLTAPFDPAEGRKLSLVRSMGATASNDPQAKKTAEFLYNFYDGPVKLPEANEKNQEKPADPNETDQSWRRIDHDWLGVSSDLAIQLDDRTNNSRHAVCWGRADRQLAQLG